MKVKQIQGGLNMSNIPYIEVLYSLERHEDIMLFFELLHHKCLYYEYPDTGAVLSDRDYDILEKGWECCTGKECVVGFDKNDQMGKSLYSYGPEAVKVMAEKLVRNRLRGK